jgi:hypothetical protein
MLKQSCKAIEKECCKSFGVGQQNNNIVLTFLPNHCVPIMHHISYNCPEGKRAFFLCQGLRSCFWQARKQILFLRDFDSFWWNTGILNLN